MFPLATGNILLKLPPSNGFSIFRVNVIYQGNQAQDFEEERCKPHPYSHLQPK
jgi:hypothetical protein